MGISFAIPIDEAMRISSQLRSNGRVTRGRIGVAIAEVNKDLAESLGLGKPRGAYVRNVEAGAPAEKAGVEPGDVILAFNDRPIEKSSDLPRIVGETKPGTRSTVTVWRKGAQRDLSVTVADVEPAEKVASKKSDPDEGKAVNALGVTVAEVSAERRKELGIKQGVEITVSGDGALARAGARNGDVIVRVGDADITSVRQFEELARNFPKNRAVAVFVRRANSTLVLPVRLGN
jgi:serine protease Do